MTNKSRCFVLLTSLCLFFISTLMLINPNRGISDQNGKMISKISYQYPKWDLAMLKNESDIIIRGIVTKSLPSYKGKVKIVAESQMKSEKAKKAEKAEKAYKEGYDIVVVVDDVAVNKAIEKFDKGKAPIYTDKKVKITKYYNNVIGLNEITVREQGGEIDNRISVISGEKSINEGNEVLLFLKKLGNKYVIFAGAPGRFFIQDNKVINGLTGKSMDIHEFGMVP